MSLGAFNMALASSTHYEVLAIGIVILTRCWLPNARCRHPIWWTLRLIDITFCLVFQAHAVSCSLSQGSLPQFRQVGRTYAAIVMVHHQSSLSWRGHHTIWSRLDSVHFIADGDHPALLQRSIDRVMIQLHHFLNGAVLGKAHWPMLVHWVLLWVPSWKHPDRLRSLYF